MRWQYVKDVVKGVNDCEVDAQVIVEALCMSKSQHEFTELLKGAMMTADRVLGYVYRDEGDND
jgi:hypothetical protein